MEIGNSIEHELNILSMFRCFFKNVDILKSKNVSYINAKVEIMYPDKHVQYDFFFTQTTFVSHHINTTACSVFAS